MLVAKRKPMLDRQRAENLMGESVREVGILMVVFAPLEATFSDVLVDAGRVAAMFLVGLLLIAGGIILEARK
jgi:hypothetical protein